MFESMRRTAGPLIEARSHGIKVNIQEHVRRKIHGWCKAGSTEVSGMGLATLENGVFSVTDAFFPEQECNTGFTHIYGESIARLRNNLRMKHGNDSPIWWKDLRFWWHTHYNFDTFWSGTDDDTAQQVAHDNGEWSLSLVVNQAGDELCRADFVQPIPIMVDNLVLNTVPNEGRVSKRNYAYDIKRWVRPIIQKEIIKPIVKPSYVWTPKGIKGVPVTKAMPFGTSHIIHGGKLMTLEQYALALECPCGDGTCIDCSSTLREEARTSEGIVESPCPCAHGGYWIDCTCLDKCLECEYINTGRKEVVN